MPVPAFAYNDIDDSHFRRVRTAQQQLATPAGGFSATIAPPNLEARVGQYLIDFKVLF
jgi:hypothetical protein